jgi:hypothetical protein
VYYPIIQLRFLLNGYLLKRTLIKYLLNFECHKTCHAHCIRCQDFILFTCKKSNATYFELHNFKYVLFDGVAPTWLRDRSTSVILINFER